MWQILVKNLSPSKSIDTTSIYLSLSLVLLFYHIELLFHLGNSLLFYSAIPQNNTGSLLHAYLKPLLHYAKNAYGQHFLCLIITSLSYHIFSK